jgi:uroporphyrinogen-III synthase
MRVMITRAEADARPLAAALRARGIDSISEPLLDIRMLDGPAPDLDGVQALLVTSANGVRAFAGRSAARTVKVYAVGDASARAAREMGFADVESADGDVDDLARLVAARADGAAGGDFLHVAGTKVAGDLAGLLKAAGLGYRRLVLYEARTAEGFSPEGREALASGAVDGVLFFSPRTAATFVALAGAAGLTGACARLVAYCLSAAVAERISGLHWADVVVAERPEQDSLLAAIARRKDELEA